jgi:hypothetical protein
VEALLLLARSGRALLPQPGGFEGLVSVEVLAKATELSLPHGHDVVDARFDRNAACCSGSAESPEHHDVFACVDVFLRVYLEPTR